MIESIRGTLLAVDAEDVVVEVGGFALRIHTPRGVGDDLARLLASPGGGPEVRLCTHTRIQPDSWQLFGFADETQRSIFRVLLGIPGIGPRLAMSLLSHLSWQEIRAAVETRDEARFQAVPGIGKRTAARIVVELQGKIEGAGPAAAPETGTPAADAVAALAALGLARSEAASLVRAVVADGGEQQAAADLIAKALKRRR